MLQAVVKAMELLALEGKIKEKTYGKQKIYFADQVIFFFLIRNFLAPKVTSALSALHISVVVRQVEVTAANLSLRPSSEM